jgi:hypothetical protein
MAKAVGRLSSLYDENSAVPPVAIAYEYWRRYRESPACLSPASPPVFVQHTYLALLARLVARHFLEPAPASAKPQELWQVVNGDYFVGFGLENFFGEDFFTWPFFRLSMGIGPEEEALDVVQELSSELAKFDLSRASPGLLTELFHQISPSEAAPAQQLPRWLAEFVLEEKLDLTHQPEQTVLDPSCGPGTFLAAAVVIKSEALLEQGQSPLDVLLRVTGQVAGMTPDPLAATIARTSYLLALGDLAREPHPPVLVPVYLADANRGPEVEVDSAGVTVHSFSMADGMSLPDRVAGDPMMLDWLFGRLPNYMRGAAARLHAQSEEVAVQEVLNAYYNYLTSPKSRTPIPEPLTPAAADVMVETARKIIQGYLHGEGHVRLFIIKNAPAPVFLARRKFDLLVGFHSGPNVSAGLDFFEDCRSAYLNDSGGAAVAVGSDNAESNRFEYALAGPSQPFAAASNSVSVVGEIVANDPGWAEIRDLNVLNFDAP